MCSFVFDPPLVLPPSPYADYDTTANIYVHTDIEELLNAVETPSGEGKI